MNAYLRNRIFQHDDLTLMVTNIQRDAHQLYRWSGNVTILKDGKLLGVLKRSSVVAPPRQAAERIASNALAFATGPNYWDWGPEGEWSIGDRTLYNVYKRLGGGGNPYGSDDDGEYAMEEVRR